MSHTHKHHVTHTLTHTQELFLKKDPLARTDTRVLAKARSFWEPFHLGNSISVNAVAKMVSGVNPKLGFRFKKIKPLLRFVFIHTETRHVTFSRKKIYAGFVDVGNRTILNSDGTKTGDWVSICLCMSACMHVCMHGWIDRCMHVWSMYVCIRSIHVYMYVCMSTYVLM